MDYLSKVEVERVFGGARCICTDKPYMHMGTNCVDGGAELQNSLAVVGKHKFLKGTWEEYTIIVSWVGDTDKRTACIEKCCNEVGSYGWCWGPGQCGVCK